MKYKLLKPLGPWKAGTSATREWWNDEGLHMQLLDDPNWFERVEEERIRLLPIGEAVPKGYRFSRTGEINPAFCLKLTPDQIEAIEAAINGDPREEYNRGYSDAVRDHQNEVPGPTPREGWTVEQMREKLPVFLKENGNQKEWNKQVEFSVNWYLHYLETLTPEPFPGWTGKDLMSMAKFAVEMDDIGRVDWVSVEKWQKWQSGHSFPAKKPDPDVNKPVDLRTWTRTKPKEQKAPASKNSNSKIGSYHWFITLMGDIKAKGEYLATHGREGSPEVPYKVWGERIFEFCKEILKWYEDQPRTYIEADKMRPEQDCIIFADYVLNEYETADTPRTLPDLFTEWSGQEPEPTFSRGQMVDWGVYCCGDQLPQCENREDVSHALNDWVHGLGK